MPKRPNWMKHSPPDLFEQADQAFTHVFLDLMGFRKVTDHNVEPDKFNKDIDFQEPVAPAPKPKKRKPGQRKKLGPRISPVTAFINNLPGRENFYTAAQVAEKLGVASSTVRHYARKGVLPIPSFHAKFGEVTISLFTDQDVELLRKYLDNRNQVLSRTWEPTPWYGDGDE